MCSGPHSASAPSPYAVQAAIRPKTATSRPVRRGRSAAPGARGCPGPAAPPGRALGAAQGVGPAGRSPAKGDGQQADRGEQEQVGGGGEVRRQEAADARAEQTAQAVRGMEAGHHGAVQGGHEIDRDAVHRHVQAAVGDAEQQQHQAEGERGVRPGRQRHAQGEEDAVEHGDALAAEPAAQPSGEHHGGHGARRHTEQGQAQLARGRADLGLDRGDANHPAREEETVDGEEDGEGDAEAAEGGDGAGVWWDRPRAVPILFSVGTKAEYEGSTQG